MQRRIPVFLSLALLALVFLTVSTTTFANSDISTRSESPALNTSYTLKPVADAYVRSDYASTNYGTAAQLRVDASPIVKSYMRFNVSGLSGAVSKAVLRVYANSGLTGGYSAYQVSNGTWSETALTYSNAPAMGSVIGSSSAVTTGTWVSIDVTKYIVGNGTFSIGLAESSSTALSLASRESTNPPQLVITTATATATATPLPIQPLPSATATRATTATPVSASPTPSGSGTGTCNFTIGTSVTTADGFGNYSGVKPGNTVCIAAGTRAGLKLINFKGTASAPITFVNSGGKVVINNTGNSGGIGIQLYGSQHVRLTGSGASSIPYGIEIDNAPNSAIDTNHIGSSGKLDGTEYVELDHVYAYSVGAGIRIAKNNDLLDTGIVWSGHQYYIHDNYINTTNAEAMYIGTSDTHGTFPIYDVQVWNNRIDNAGYDGIQIRQAHTKVLVHHNTINGTGRDPRKNGTIDNTAGFNIAKGTDTGDWYDNLVIGARTAFYIKDSANVRVYNNTAIDSGHTTPYSGPEGAVQIINAKNVQFMFNTIVNRTINGAYGITINSGSTGTVHDNIVGGTFGNLITGSAMAVSSNVSNSSLTYFGFVNPTGNNYRLMAGSPAVNQASTNSFPTVDMDNIGRPQGTKSDVGAYEYH